MTADRSDELAQELERLRDENVRLAGLLDAHGIAWRLDMACIHVPRPPPSQTRCEFAPWHCSRRAAVHAASCDSKGMRVGIVPSDPGRP